MSRLTVKKMNRFLFFKIPSAYFSGVRVSKLTNDFVEVKVKYSWRSMNPFKSVYWAVQGMASEMTTGVLVMQHIAKSGANISMLVTHQTADFHKKAIGKIIFTCKGSSNIEEAMNKAIETKEGQTFQLISEGFDEQGDKVSSFMYQWSIKVKA